MEKNVFYGGSKFGAADDNLEGVAIHHGIQRAIMKLLEQMSQQENGITGLGEINKIFIKQKANKKEHFIKLYSQYVSSNTKKIN